MIYNNGRYEQEIIAAEKWMRIVYENPVGSAALPWLVKRKVFSRLYGLYCRTKHSSRKIPRFIRENQVDMTGCGGEYKSYAEFFTRKKSGLVFPSESGVLGSPCEGLVLACQGISADELIAAKGSVFSLAELLGDKELAGSYEGGSMLHIRLTPANYHRAHFFDDGTVITSKFINGDLFSVNPLALKRVARLYCRNKRAVILFSSDNFGDAAMVLVGATFVGSIVHCFEDGQRVGKGDECSYFMPGGSLLIIFFKKNTLMPCESLLEQTRAGYETKIKVGEVLGTGEQKLGL